MGHSKQIVNRLDNSFGLQEAKISYPYILIEYASDAIPYLVQAIQPGDLQLVFNFDGRLRSPYSIAKLPRELLKLVKVYDFTIVYSPNEKEHICRKEDILEAKLWMQV